MWPVSRLIVSMSLRFTEMEASNSAVAVVKGLRGKGRDGVYLKMEKHLGRVMLGGIRLLSITRAWGF